MTARLPLTSYFPLLIATAVGAGCTSTIHMQTPPGLASAADDVTVSRPFKLFDTSFSLGPFRVDHVATGMQTGFRFHAPLFSHGHTESGYSYNLERPLGPVHGECHDEATSNDVLLGKVAVGRTSLRLECACGESDPPTAVLSLQGVKGGELVGTLSLSQGPTYKLKSVYEMEGGGWALNDPVGFRMDSDRGGGRRGRGALSHASRACVVSQGSGPRCARSPGLPLRRADPLSAARRIALQLVSRLLAGAGPSFYRGSSRPRSGRSTSFSCSRRYVRRRG